MTFSSLGKNKQAGHISVEATFCREHQHFLRSPSHPKRPRAIKAELSLSARRCDRTKDSSCNLCHLTATPSPKGVSGPANGPWVEPCCR